MLIFFLIKDKDFIFSCGTMHNKKLLGNIPSQIQWHLNTVMDIIYYQALQHCNQK